MPDVLSSKSMRFIHLGFLVSELLASCYPAALAHRAKNDLVFRVSFLPGHRIAYLVERRDIRSNLPARSSTFDVVCTDKKGSEYNVEVQEEGVGSIESKPLCKKTWISDQGHSHHSVVFWLAACPVGVVKLNASWKGCPPPLAASMGAILSSAFNYKLIGIEVNNQRKAARIGFGCVQRATRRNRVETHFQGMMLLDVADGQILDYQITRSDSRSKRGSTAAERMQRLTYTARIVRL